VSSKADSEGMYEDEFGNFTNKKREYLQEVIRDRNGEFQYLQNPLEYKRARKYANNKIWLIFSLL